MWFNNICLVYNSNTTHANLMNFSMQIFEHVKCKVVNFMGCLGNHVWLNHGGGR